MNNLRFREFYRRRLPHIQVPGATYFVTFRLKNSLPVGVLEALAADSEQIKKLPTEQQYDAHRRWFGKFDEYLDRCQHGEKFLETQEVAETVADSLHFRDGQVYDLLAFCIMPNHAHVVFAPRQKLEDGYYSLTEILHSLKRNSAKQANLILGRTGVFWQDESYDHVVRDDAELERIIKYVIYNPVKAGFTDDWKNWKWTYCLYRV